LLGECPDVTVPLFAGLTSDGYRVRQIVPGRQTRVVRADCYETDFGSPQLLSELHRLLQGGESDVVGCVINLLPLCEPFCRPGLNPTGLVTDLATWSFNFVKEFGDDLCASAEAQGGWFFNVTSLDGTFGLTDSGGAALTGGGTIGLAKALKRESQSLRVRNLDIKPNTEPSIIVSQLLEELWSADDSIEIGLGSNSRTRLQMTDSPTPETLTSLPVDEQSVILVTGGAYGITADVTKALAARRPQLFVLGRSEAPADEDSATGGLDETGLRAIFLEQARCAGTAVLPAEIESSVQRVLKERRIRSNLAAFAELGARVEYRAIDVRDSEQFGGLIDELYERFGKIDGVIHGAGVIYDKLIRDKSLETFDSVFGTKVDAALTLAEKLRPEQLKFLIFFSSISARFGNAGQADYSAANEYLNKLANHLNSRWPGRVSAINWGPWEAGMFTGELARVYAARGIHPIPVDVGVQFFERELAYAGNGSAEVVVSAGLEAISDVVVGV